MKVILLFDTDKLDNTYRTYELTNGADAALRKGKWVSATFCHPKHGEVMRCKIGDKKELGCK